MQWSCRTWRPNGFKVIHAKPNQLKRWREVFEIFLRPEEKPRSTYTDSCLELIKACIELNWNHETSTQRISETHGVAERAVRRGKEGTSAVLIGSVWTSRKLVGRSNWVLLLSWKCARPTSRLPDISWTSVQFTVWRAGYSIWSRSTILHNIIKRPRSSASVRHVLLGILWDTLWTREEVGLVIFWLWMQKISKQCHYVKFT